MAAVTTGKLIIRSIPDGQEREKVIDFLVSCAKGVAREAVAARVETLPLILSSAMPADIGNNVLRSLQELGADVVFVNNENPPVHQEPIDDKITQRPEITPAIEPEKSASGNSARPASQSRAPRNSPANHDIRTLVILLLILVAGLCGASILFLPSLKAASDPDLLLNKLLQKNAAMNNKFCPRNINPQIRLDGYLAGNKKMTINYTLLNVNATDVNGNDLRPSVSRHIREGLCSDKRATELLKKDVAFVFAVHGKDGGLIFDYQVLNEDCES